MIVLSSNAELVLPTKFIKHASQKQFPSANILKGTTLVKLTGKRSLNMKDVKVIHREKAPSNKTPAITKSTHMGIWVVGTSNQLFIRVLKLKQNFQKNKVVTGKTISF